MMEVRQRRGDSPEEGAALLGKQHRHSTEDEQMTKQQDRKSLADDGVAGSSNVAKGTAHKVSGGGETVSSESSTRNSNRRASFKKKAGYGILCYVTLGLLITYVVIPLWFYSSPWLRQHVVFLSFVSIPPFLNLSNPDNFGLYCPTNFYAESEPGLKLGAWHIPSINEPCDRSSPLKFSGPDPVVLYLHGNAGSRGSTHRVELYKILSNEAKVHVVAMDYRGYGDSSTEKMPTVDGLVQDALAMYRKIREIVPAKRIFVWGHSLGTGVSTYLLANLTQANGLPAGLVLESPFDTVSNAVKHNPMLRLHRFMPMFDKFFVDSINNHPDTNFNSLEKSKLIDPALPIVILEAKDDLVIPFELAERLYQSFVEARHGAKREGRVEFVTFASEYGYGHKYIYSHPGLATRMRVFFDEAIDRQKLNAIFG